MFFPFSCFFFGGGGGGGGGGVCQTSKGYMVSL